MLKDKVAIVTGASRGIGFEITKEFARRGATVVACSRNIVKYKEAITAAADLSGKDGMIFVEQLDVTDAHGVKQFFGRVIDRHRRVDILINNAGYPFDRKIWYKKFHEVTDEEFDQIIAVDFKGALRMSQAAIPFMVRNGGGVIVSISSTPAISGHTEGMPYTLAKAAVIAMTKHIALEYGTKNIRAYALALGNIATSATFKSMTAKEREKAAMENAMKRWGTPAEVAKAAASIADDDFSFATGNTIVLDGGTVLL